MNISTVKTSTWKARQEKAIKRLVAAWETYEEGDDSEKVSAAVDAVALAHIALAFEWADEPRQHWKEQEDKALERLAAVWGKCHPTVEDPEAEEALNILLDALTLAHTAATFEWASGPAKW